MAKQGKGPRPKRVANRTCIACREVAGKRTLLRLVRTPAGVEIDTTGKKAGRGAYLHPDAGCWRVALESRRIEQALRTRLTAADRKALGDFMASLPDAAIDDVAKDDAALDDATSEDDEPVDVSRDG